MSFIYSNQYNIGLTHKLKANLRAFLKAFEGLEKREWRTAQKLYTKNLREKRQENNDVNVNVEGRKKNFHHQNAINSRSKGRKGGARGNRGLQGVPQDKTKGQKRRRVRRSGPGRHFKRRQISKAIRAARGNREKLVTEKRRTTALDKMPKEKKLGSSMSPGKSWPA